MFKTCRKEDLRIVALELGETVAEKVIIVELTEIIKQNKYFKEDVEFVKELIQYTIEDRKKAEEDRKRAEKDRKRAEEDRKRMQIEEDHKKEAENRLREKELELELARLNISVNSDNERTGEGCNTLDALVKSVRILTVKVPNRPEGWAFFFASLERAFVSKNVPGKFNSLEKEVASHISVRAATTSTDDRYIKLKARRNRTENATQLQRQLLLATGRRVSSQTVRNRLRGGGLYARRPMICIPLTPRHRASRRRWAAEHRDWEQHDWSQVLLTDESRFSLECDTRRVLVWRDRGTRNNPAFVRERSRYRRAGWMVWGGISIGGRTDLHIIRNGTLTSRRYADEMLRPHVIPYAGAIVDSFVFQDDNTRPHRAPLVENMLAAETIQRMEWPAYSPDLNPIEHVWDRLGRRIAARPRPSATVRDLEIALLEEWNSIPQRLIDNHIATMANKCAAVLAVRGDHTPY
ncbi:transposable element Tcb2 transposase [Trichonephila clavipes]|nr:transposable element Tcb2 transposase [Trichonephila clavipes]